MSLTETPVPELVRRAAAADAAAWRAVVDRYQPMLWRIALRHRLCAADAADVCQYTWLRLTEHLPALREPARLGSWLATTARRESLRLAGVRARETVREQWEAWQEPGQGPEALALLDDRDSALWKALHSLPERCRALLTLFAFAPELSYAQLARAVDVSLGSVGSNRGRCFTLLRRRLLRAGFVEVAG
ncbi:MAG: RNA polymerase sigma factor [Sciscionella sp.]